MHMIKCFGFKPVRCACAHIGWVYSDSTLAIGDIQMHWIADILCELMRTQLVAIDLPFYCHHCASIVYDWMECGNHLSFFSFSVSFYYYMNRMRTKIGTARESIGVNGWVCCTCMHVPSHCMYACARACLFKYVCARYNQNSRHTVFMGL